MSTQGAWPLCFWNGACSCMLSNGWQGFDKVGSEGALAAAHGKGGGGGCPHRRARKAAPPERRPPPRDPCRHSAVRVPWHFSHRTAGRCCKLLSGCRWTADTGQHAVMTMWWYRPFLRIF